MINEKIRIKIGVKSKSIILLLFITWNIIFTIKLIIPSILPNK